MNAYGGLCFQGACPGAHAIQSAAVREYFPSKLGNLGNEQQAEQSELEDIELNVCSSVSDS